MDNKLHSCTTLVCNYSSVFWLQCSLIKPLTAEVRAWTINHIPYKTKHVITHPCQNLNKTVLVKTAPGTCHNSKSIVICLKISIRIFEIFNSLAPGRCPISLGTSMCVGVQVNSQPCNGSLRAWCQAITRPNGGLLPIVPLRTNNNGI